MKKTSIIFVFVALLITALIIVFAVRKRDKREVAAPKNQEAVAGQAEGSQGEERVAPNPFPDDLDRDGLTNDEEAKLGTSELEFDTDGDGVSDVDELDYWKTDPTKTDTDGDGFSDGWEILQGFNPNGEGAL